MVMMMIKCWDDDYDVDDYERDDGDSEIMILMLLRRRKIKIHIDADLYRTEKLKFLIFQLPKIRYFSRVEDLHLAPWTEAYMLLLLHTHTYAHTQIKNLYTL